MPSDVPEWYCRQLVSEVRKIVAGKPVWTPLSTDNHALDAEALAAAVGRLLNVERISEGMTRDWDESAPPPLTEALQAAPETRTAADELLA